MKKSLNMKFTYMMVATIISALGSYAFNFAFMTHIYNISGQDKTYMGLTQLFFISGMLLGNISGGPLGEKHNRKHILVLCEAIRLPLSLIFIFTNNIWALLITHGLKTYFAGVSTPIKRAFITDIVDKENIDKANNLFSASYAIVHILGPLIGTWGYSYFKQLDEIVYLDMATFVISIILLGLIVNIVEKKKEKSHFFDDLKEGINHIKARYDLRGLYERHALVGVFSGIVIPLILPFLTEVLGKTEKEYGIMMVVFGAGGITGAIFNKKVSKKFGLGKTLFFTSLIEPILLFIWAMGFNYYISLGVFYLWGILFFTRAPGQFNYLANFVDKGFISRTNAVLDFIFTLTNISASFLISAIGNNVQTKQLLMGAAIFYAIINILRVNAVSSIALKREEYEAQNS
jgi:MFS family permease